MSECKQCKRYAEYLVRLDQKLGISENSSRPRECFIDDLLRKLSEAKAGWDSCIADLRTAAQICKQTEVALAEARKAATVSDQRIIIESLLIRLNNKLVDMKPEWDDSITGFNDAMDIVRAALNNPINPPAPEVKP